MVSMKFHVFGLALILIGIIVSHEAQGQSNASKSLEQDMELETQLKILNKPPIMSFKDENGGFIDCIDIYKQPAFDNPLLKNHKLQMRPSSLPKSKEMIGEQDSSKLSGRSKRKFSGCPIGTVPFKRTEKKDLIRANSILQSARPRPINQNAPLANMHYAAVTTPDKDPSQKFYGAQTSISVYNLSKVVGSQISEAMLWLGSATDGPYNSIEYGWTVNPQLYGDNQPRTYSLWTADGLQKTGCYNALCPGYVQVSQKRIMGEVNHPVSVFGKDIYAMEFHIFKDHKTGNWWLMENLGDKKNEPVGYWPKELFTSMKDYATVTQLGGKVYGPPDMPTNPPMGSGAFITDDFTRTCYASNINFVNSQNQLYPPKDVPMNVVADEPNTYKADYLGDASKEHPQRGYTLLFGGPDIRT